MFLKIYTKVLLFGCILCLNVFSTTAQDSSADTIASSVRITSYSDPFNTNSFTSNIQPATPISSNQQLISSTFSDSSAFSSASSKSSTASYGLLPPQLVPNVFARAVLDLPILQRFLNLRFQRFQGANLLFNAVFDAMQGLGSPIAATIADTVAQNIAGLDYFSVPVYIYIKGESVEKFFLSEGVEIQPGLVQLYKNSMDKAFQSTILNNIEDVLSAVQKGYIIFIESLNYTFIKKAYVLGLAFNEEAIATIEAIKP